LLFSSIQLFRHSESQKIKKIYFSEFWLFLLRALVLSLLITILADPFSETDQSEIREKWLLIDPNVDEKLIAEDIDSLEKSGYSRHYLQTGLPTTKHTEENQSRFSNTWSLIEEAQEFASDIDVFTYSLQRNFRLERPKFKSNIVWHQVPQSKTTETTLAKTDDNEFKLISSETESRIETKTISNPNYTVSEQTVLIVYDDHFLADLRYIDAALETVNSIGLTKINTRKIKSEQFTDKDTADCIIWLSDQTLQRRQSRIKYLVYEAHHFQDLISRQNGYFSINRRLIANENPKVFSDELPRKLSQLLIDLPKTEIARNDMRIISYPQLQSAKSSDDTSGKKQESLVHYFWIILFAFLILERHYSVGRSA
ncbi:MAG: hypothetical protein KDD94_13825, partial [Calditrichaeota bacterium]|nr:hypothetical protein [Calditrichota bacterium]